MRLYRRRSTTFVLAITALAAVVTTVSLATRPSGAGRTHIVNADDPSLTLRGRRLYAQHCAACHGRYLQGQPLWQLADHDSPRRAPAHDQTGHTWMHSDEDLFAITKFGRFPATPLDRISFMPAFRDQLDDEGILAVIAFIEASWPRGLRVMHAALNPGHAVMPRDTGIADWRLPAWCMPHETPAPPSPG